MGSEMCIRDRSRSSGSEGTSPAAGSPSESPTRPADQASHQASEVATPPGRLPPQAPQARPLLRPGCEPDIRRPVLFAFLAGSAFGLFILGLLRRDERPGPPIDLRVAADGKALSLWWSAPERGGRVEHYIAEGLVEGGWRPIAEFKRSLHHGEIPTSETEGAAAWRLRAANGAGQSEPSVEADRPKTD